jgi:hypothetical protein
MGRGDEWTQVTRRTYLRTVGTATAAAVGFGTTATAFEGLYAGRVTTRGQFIAQLLLGVDYTAENDRTNYRTSGTIPGLTDDASPSELVVFVHRYDEGLEAALNRFLASTRDSGRRATTRLWPDTTGTPMMDAGNRPSLSRTGTRTNSGRSSETTRKPDPTPTSDWSRTVAGQKTVAECLEFFMDREYGTTVTSVDFLGGAIDSDSVATDGQYGQAIVDHCETCRNTRPTTSSSAGPTPGRSGTRPSATPVWRARPPTTTRSTTFTIASRWPTTAASRA